MLERASIPTQATPNGRLDQNQIEIPSACSSASFYITGARHERQMLPANQSAAAAPRQRAATSLPNVAPQTTLCKSDADEPFPHT